MADKYLRRDGTTGFVSETAATATSAGAADSGKIPALDSSGRLDPTMMPVGVVADTYSNNATGALSAGDLAYVKSDGTIARASAASAGNGADGFVLAASATGTPALLYFEGRNTAVTGLTVGSRYYLSDSSPGGITTTPVSGTGKLHQYVGKAISATSLDFEPDDVIVLA